MLWQTQTLTTPEASGTVTFSFTGQDRNLYAFHGVATDAAGNVESKSSNTIEASTSVPDLNPPVTHVLASSPTYSWGPFPASEFGGLTPSSYSNGVFTLTWAGADPDQDTGLPAGSIALVDIYAKIDSGTPTLIGQLNAGAPNNDGVYSGTMTYDAMADGQSHTYSFFSVGIDDQQKAQPQPTTPDATFTETYSTALAVDDLEVEKGIAERSFIQYLDVNFNQTSATSTALASLAAGLTGTDPGAYMVLYWYGESLTADSQPLGSVNLFGKGTTTGVSLSGTDLEINFGSKGLTGLLSEYGITGTGGATTSFGDGWYALGINTGGTSGSGPIFWETFYRLLGSATGDETVSGPYSAAGTDAYVVYNAEGQSGALRDADVNGDGSVNAKDFQETVAASGHSVGATAPQAFPQFQLLAGVPSSTGTAVPIAQGEVQALMPEAIDAWRAAGLDAADVRRLEDVPVRVGDLGKGILGLEAGGVIAINRTAAGDAWYLGGDSAGAFTSAGAGGEELAVAGGPSAGRVDLLTVLEHELGHVLGLPDDAAGRRPDGHRAEGGRPAVALGRGPGGDRRGCRRCRVARDGGGIGRSFANRAARRSGLAGDGRRGPCVDPGNGRGRRSGCDREVEVPDPIRGPSGRQRHRGARATAPRRRGRIPSPALFVAIRSQGPSRGTVVRTGRRRADHNSGGARRPRPFRVPGRFPRGEENRRRQEANSIISTPRFIMGTVSLIGSTHGVAASGRIAPPVSLRAAESRPGITPAAVWIVSRSDPDADIRKRNAIDRRSEAGRGIPGARTARS